MNRRRVLAGCLAALVALALCAGLAALYVELLVGFESKPMARLPADADVSSIMSTRAYAQAFVDQWKPGLELTAVYGQYREDEQGRVVASGEITYVFVGSREDWLAPIARLMGVHLLEATVDVDVDRKMTTYFRPSHSDRSLWLPMHPGEWGISEDELLRVAEDNGGRQFRRTHPNAEIGVEVAGHYMGDEWLQTYYSDEGKMWILIDLSTGDVLMAEGQACDLFPSSWRTVAHIAR